jgi:eukaryotic-like serine/threonine-protein kinase
VTDYVIDGRYRLTERIASGGMGEVWSGIDEVLNRPIAVKLLASAHADDPSFRARFRAEARYSASLSHPGIARVFDYGETSQLGSAYLIMELVEGEPLSAILDREGRLSPAATLDIIGQAAAALQVAHQAGIVHRDMKPGNILVKPDGTTKITDFGIATAVLAAQASHLTQTGIVMGTAMYVSPEQATGATVTGSSDIYSLGIVAYECLAGNPPFSGDQPLAIAIAHKHDPVPPLPDDVPGPVRDLVMAMLEKDPQDRPETARHVADRCGVVREALSMSGPQTWAISPHGPARAGDGRSAEPVTAPGEAFFPERPGGTPAWNRRRLMAAATTVAVCGIGAIVAVVLSASAPMSVTGNNSTQNSPSPAFTPSVPGMASPSSSGGHTLGTEPQQTQGPLIQPTVAHSATPKAKASATTAPASSPPAAPTTPTATTPAPPTTAPATGSPPPGGAQQASQAG